MDFVRIPTAMLCFFNKHGHYEAICVLSIFSNLISTSVLIEHASGYICMFDIQFQQKHLLVHVFPAHSEPYDELRSRFIKSHKSFNKSFSHQTLTSKQQEE